MRESVASFEAASGLVAGEGLGAFLVSDEVSPAWLERLRASKAHDPWLHGFAVIEQSTGAAVGMAGFKGPPDDAGVVEIAYGIVPSREGRGYATEAARALVTFASADSRVRRVQAHTLPTRNASTAVLTKNGFEFAGEVNDPEDGLVWRWTRAVSDRLRPPTNDAEWAAYHAIRRRVLFELRGRGDAYDPNHPDERRAGHHPFIFWSGSAPIGVVRVDIDRDIAVFRRVAIHDEFQRRGHGRALLAAAEEFARAQGCAQVESHVDAAAIRFYERCGYVRAATSTGDVGATLVTKSLD